MRQICDPYRAQEHDLTLNLRLCDVVNYNFVLHGKDAVKALKLKLELRKDGTACRRALYALEMCMKNCGPRFHAMVCAKEVPKTLVKLCEKPPNAEVRDNTLRLIEEWAANLSRREPGYGWAFDTLRAKGFRFPDPVGAVRTAAPPAVEGASMAQYNGRGDWSARNDLSEEDRRAIAAALAEVDDDAQGSPRSPHGVYAGTIATGVPKRSPSMTHGRYDPGTNDYQRALRESAAASAAPSASASVSYTAEDVRKLKGDVAAARNSLKVFAEVLDGVDVSQHPSSSGLLDGIASELAEQCRAMSPRLQELISNTHDEELLMSALSLNEDLVKELARFDLLFRASTGDATALANVRAQRAKSSVPTVYSSKATTASLLDELDDVIKASTPQRNFTANQTQTANPFNAAQGPPNPFDAPPSYASSAGPSSSSTSMALVGPSSSSMANYGQAYEFTPTPSGPSSTPAMQTNPMFAQDPYASDARTARPLPQGMRAMNGAPVAPSPPPVVRTPGAKAPVADPFADLSAAAASRAATSSSSAPKKYDDLPNI